VSEREPVIIVCASCASQSVTREAWVTWDVPTQRWMLAELFDHAFCHGCHRRVALEERLVE
jgi:hypothetical protein